MDVAGRGGPGSRNGARRRLEREGDGAGAQRRLAPSVRDGGREVLGRVRLGAVLEGFERDGELSGGRSGGGRRGEEEEERAEERELVDEEECVGKNVAAGPSFRRCLSGHFFFDSLFPREGRTCLSGEKREERAEAACGACKGSDLSK